MKCNYKKYGVMGLIVCFTILSILYIINQKNNQQEIISSIMAEEDKEENEERGEIDSIVSVEKIPVYICGQVQNPDVYYIEEGTIIKDAILIAGGFAPEADEEVWNLAMEVKKGQKIYIPKVGEKIDKTDVSYDNREGGDTTLHLINVNEANTQDLCTIPGIGPVTSQNIIEYRQANGDFGSLDDLGKVSRIGPGTLEKVKDYICFQ